MHDLLLAKEMLEIAIDYAKKNKLASLTEIMIELGQIEDHAEDITSQNLKSVFNLIKTDTIANKAKLKIKKVSGSHWKLISIK